MNHWHLIQAQHHRQERAALAIASLGFQAYVPKLQVRRQVARRVVEVEQPRFGVYIFASFDRDVPGWQELQHAIGKEAGIVRVFCDAAGCPIIVPERAMLAVQAFRPRPIEVKPAHVYQPGEPVLCTIAGVRREAVFVEYCGSRPFVRMWIFGSDRVTEVSNAELEPLDDDGQVAAGSAP